MYRQRIVAHKFVSQIFGIMKSSILDRIKPVEIKETLKLERKLRHIMTVTFTAFNHCQSIQVERKTTNN